MVQYQSFPDAAGDSRTSDKLKALRLPAIEGKSFLDIGCNEGYFCGFSHFMGAARSVGIDHSPEFIYRAQTRFPECEFHARTWDHLPEGEFDVILLASALHYADDQPGLIDRLVEKLTPDGVLILELGIVSSPRAEWVKVKRGIDERYFPTMAQLKRTLIDYAWKWMGPSVNQDGDPVPRHVIHVSHRKPIAYLLMQPPAYGKSSVASRLFPPAKVPIVSGDEIIQRIAKRELSAPGKLQDLIEKDYSPFSIDKTIQRVFDKKMGGELVQVWVAEGGDEDFAVDGFVPAKYQAQVEAQLAEAGYMPVTLRWERVAPSLVPLDSLNEQTAEFNRSLSVAGREAGDNADKGARQSSAGYVDEVKIQDGHVVVRGWAIDATGSAPEQLVLGIGADRTFVEVGDPQERKDVQRHLELPHAKLGYVIKLPVPVETDFAGLARQGFSVTLASGRPLRLAQRVIESMQGAAEPDEAGSPSS
ncbi:class I SAM-dependent methyltransferase [Lysobacter sp. H23M47]|uniref:class I SAM-dependent methyltransferase n=1 Tax=Lysobacter sp. H23M47 TaxID=2781024 RepID=UPI00187E8383|nr:class I SAM-dependent methyltransferase [Lysobacter sp. H23M47]QOW24169.1 class I SAM-dependent methyltransferase [Lysobacter sp. H23M47]